MGTNDIKVGVVGLAVLLGLGACQPQKPAAEPSQPKPGASKEASSFKPDAMKAMAELAGQWTIVGVGDGKGETPSSWHRHQSSGTCMPLGSPSWELKLEKVFASDDEGVSLWNEQAGALVTLYTYPAQRSLEDEFEAVGKEVSGTCSDGPVMSTEQGPYHFMGCVSRLEDGLLLLEQVMLFQKDRWFFKARATLPQPVLPRAYAATMALAAQAFKPCPAQ